MSGLESSRSAAVMGTIVSIRATSARAGDDETARREQAISRGLEWFDDIERRCTRFNPGSELMRLTARAGEAVRVSPMVFETIRFALAVAQETGGAFDPTIGCRMEDLGFNREHRTGTAVHLSPTAAGPVTFKDVALDHEEQTVRLRRPLVLDLGAVAKGLAIDMAVRELSGFAGFAVDAGGDLYLGGTNPDGHPWSVGIRHPRRDGELIDTLTVTNLAVCTSGDYERRASGDAGGHHIIDPRTGRSAPAVASVTVVAPSALLADALGTAAFVLGPAEGIRLLERHGVDGLIISPELERHATPGLNSEVRRHGCAVAG